MEQYNIKYIFISLNSKYYNEVVDLRYRVFYKPTNTPISAVFDTLEKRSYHLAAVLNDKVVGYMRLTVDDDIGQLSQFVIEENMRGKITVAKNLFELLVKKAKENNVHELWGEIRLPVTNIAKRYGFSVSNEIFPSSKTGILHRRIEKKI
ncbi:GNAT family N-acetyltransferase [Clostridium sp. BJN0013]|uniref:GNAT family N-acetyltransferase n=1 Tax=Clostridium sp. BJN0013 TaxID=3236840 RepID=UPI0034C5EB34